MISRGCRQILATRDRDQAGGAAPAAASHVRFAGAADSGREALPGRILAGHSAARPALGGCSIRRAASGWQSSTASLYVVGEYAGLTGSSRAWLVAGGRQRPERRAPSNRSGASMIESSDGGAKSTLYCSFCGKSQHEVRKLIAGPNVFICNECVELCADIIKEEDRKSRKGAGPSVMTPFEINGRAGRLRDRAGAGQARAGGRGAQPLQAPGARLQGRRGRAREVEHPPDRAHRLRQDAARPDPRAHARRAVHDGGRDHA